MNFTDPTGHRECSSWDDCTDFGTTPFNNNFVNKYFSSLGDDSLKSPKDWVTSSEGRDLIISQEGNFNHLYNDGCQLGPGYDTCFKDTSGENGVGNCTIGIGHLVHSGPCNGSQSEKDFVNGLSDDEVKDLFNDDLAQAEDMVERLITKKITQHQFNALVDLAYGWTYDWFSQSEKVVLLNNGKYLETALHFRKGPLGPEGMIYDSLKKRRELDLFMFLKMVE